MLRPLTYSCHLSISHYGLARLVQGRGRGGRGAGGKGRGGGKGGGGPSPTTEDLNADLDNWKKDA